MALGICLCPCMSLQESVKVLAIIDAVRNSELFFNVLVLYQQLVKSKIIWLQILSTLNLILYILALIGLSAMNYIREPDFDDEQSKTL